MFTGPTDSMFLADETNAPVMLAWNRVDQAKHGYLTV